MHTTLGGTRPRGGPRRLWRLGAAQDDQHHDARRDEQQRYELRGREEIQHRTTGVTDRSHRTTLGHRDRTR